MLSRDIEDWKKENRRLKKALAMHHARVAGDAEKRQKVCYKSSGEGGIPSREEISHLRGKSEKL